MQGTRRAAGGGPSLRVGCPEPNQKNPGKKHSSKFLLQKSAGLTRIPLQNEKKHHGAKASILPVGGAPKKKSGAAWCFWATNAVNVESMELACRNVTEEPSEANLVKLLDLWSTEWKHQGRTRAVGPGAFDKYCTLGLFGHGGVCGVSNATARQAACAAVNRFLTRAVFRRGRGRPSPCFSTLIWACTATFRT